MTFIPQINNFNNISKIAFRSNTPVYMPQGQPLKDGFATNPLYDNFGNKAQIEATINSNPRIQQILKEHNMPAKVNMAELEKLKNGHLRDTRVVSAKVYSSLPQEMKGQVNLPHLQEAAMLHDYGKVLIPDSILNKNGRLTDAEREIMNLHSELGYELLKNKGLSDETLDLIKYHHQNPSGTGYPAINAGFEYGVDAQILNIADKYAALTEKRSYKEALSKEEALKIIYEDVEKGLISEEVFNALAKAV